MAKGKKDKQHYGKKKKGQKNKQRSFLCMTLIGNLALNSHLLFAFVYSEWK